jgi:hypothetical protein
MVDAVAHAPLHVERRQSGVTDDGLVPRRRPFRPIGEVSAVARAGGSLPRAVDEREAFDCFVGCVVDVVGGAFQRIAEDVERKLLAVPGRASRPVLLLRA